jgi:hypothetical protein
VYEPAATPELASVPVPVTLADPLKLPLVYVRSPVIAMVRPVVSVAAEPVVFWLPAVFTPGKLMLAEPLKETPPMVLAV